MVLFSSGWLDLAVLAALVVAAFFRFRAKDPYSVANLVGPNRFFIGTMPEALASVGCAQEMQLKWCKQFNYTHCAMTIPGDMMYILFDPRDAHYILHTKFDNFEKGPRFADCFRPLLGDGIFAVDGPKWRTQRKVAAHMFSANQLRSRMQETFEHHCKVLHNVLDSKIAKSPNKSCIVDFQSLAFSFTFDSICSIAFGTNVSALESEPVSLEFQRAYDLCNEVTLRRHFLAPIQWKVENLLNYGLEGKLNKDIKFVNEFVYGIVRERRKELNNTSSESKEGSSKYQDLLSLYVQYASKKDLPEFTDEFLRDVILNFIIAGRDTTACAMTWMMYVLGTRPDIEAKILKEIEELGNPEFIDYDTAQKMTYTIAFFYEVCRLYPPVPVDQKVAVVEETLPSGLKVKPGDLVAWSIIVMNRNPTYWEKPLEIRPERWMNSEGDIKEFDTSLYPSFNGMPRLCLGKPMAQFEAVTVIGGLLQKYKFKLANGLKEPEFNGTVTLCAKNGLPIVLTPR